MLVANEWLAIDKRNGLSVNIKVQIFKIKAPQYCVNVLNTRTEANLKNISNYWTDLHQIRRGGWLINFWDLICEKCCRGNQKIELAEMYQHFGG